MAKYHKLSLVFIAGVLALSSVPSVAFGFEGIPEEQMDIYNRGIRSFNTSSIECTTANGSGGSDDSGVSGSGYSRLKSAVKQYGQTAMEMQREFGTPWEVVFAQMQKESGMGTAGVAIHGADNNWLGIKGTGDAGSYNGFAKFSSVDAMIRHWAGPKVLRNGAYDEAFPYLDPNNYDLEGFLKKMISVYAPSSDGNAPETYVQDVLSYINGPIADAKAEMGWSSSGELASQENIQPGGSQPIGGEVSSSSSSGCVSGGGDLGSMAIQLSYDHRGEYRGNPIAAYDAAMSEVNTRVACTGPKMGDSCDVFVATVYRKTVDPDFPCCGTSNMRSKLRTNGKYELVVDGYRTTASSTDLQPGDIMILNGHIMMYVTLEDGTGKIASASHCDRTSDHAGTVYFSDSRGSYDVLRWKGGS
jgi:hypothetical protein